MPFNYEDIRSKLIERRFRDKYPNDNKKDGIIWLEGGQYWTQKMFMQKSTQEIMK